MSLLLFLAPLGSPLDVSLGHVEGANIHSHLLSIEQRINAETGGHKKNKEVHVKQCPKTAPDKVPGLLLRRAEVDP